LLRLGNGDLDGGLLRDLEIFNRLLEKDLVGLFEGGLEEIGMDSQREI
jgi:hypothetical protein